MGVKLVQRLVVGHTLGGFVLSHIQCAKVIPGSKFEVFDYLSSPAHLAEQLKGYIDVKWQNPGVELKPGSEFLFLMARFGIEQPIRFVIDRLVLGNSLTYRQVSGVYARFVHTMKFEDHGQNETLVTDLIEYEIPFGLVGRIADDFFIRQDLKKLLVARLDQAFMRFSAKRDGESAKSQPENDELKAKTGTTSTSV